MRKHPVPGDRLLPHGLKIIHEDPDLLVVDKPSGLLSVRADLKRAPTAHEILEDYIRKGQARSRKRLFVVHRIDRLTSGVMIFAKTEQARDRLQADWGEATAKTYLAVVHGHLPEPSGTVSSYLVENAQMTVYSTDDPDKGKLSHTAWRVLREDKDASLLEVSLLTGRKNQIRVHMADLGHPVVGDPKYGERGKDGNRLALHAWKLAFRHPRDARPMQFTAPPPPLFGRLPNAGKPDPPAALDRPVGPD
jgi:tRNA pseudouridine32 synthase/23S rRNA pseudouridine746 synthase/23S rRNA pseudouridine1911/1915/1917 synthase